MEELKYLREMIGSKIIAVTEIWTSGPGESRLALNLEFEGGPTACLWAYSPPEERLSIRISPGEYVRSEGSNLFDLPVEVRPCSQRAEGLLNALLYEAWAMFTHDRPDGLLLATSETTGVGLIAFGDSLELFTVDADYLAWARWSL